MYSRTRTFSAEVHKSNIRVTRWHNKYKILNCIERHNFCLSDLLTNSNRTTLQSYKVEERTFGTPCTSLTIADDTIYRVSQNFVPLLYESLCNSVRLD